MMKDDSDRLRGLIQAHLDQCLSDAEFEELCMELDASPSARNDYAELVRLDAGLKDSLDGGDAAGARHDLSAVLVPFQPRQSMRWVWAMAAAVAVSLAATLLLRQVGEAPVLSQSEHRQEATRGIAVITAQAGAKWGELGASRLGLGVALEPGRVILQQGMAQIDFFGGASISLSGPAELELISRDAAILHSGSLKADVPPAARGFEIRAADVVLEDLGTSFGLAMNNKGQGRMQVFDGEVRVLAKDAEPLLLEQGESVQLTAGKALRQNKGEAGGRTDFPDIMSIIAESGGREETRYAAWKEWSLDFRRDPRLLAYYDFEDLTTATRRLRNQALHGDGTELDGGIVGARVEQGRWGEKRALDFRQEGDRVRFQIAGEFKAISIYAWVRIDALDRQLNSLFLTDHFDENEIHWQLSRRGELLFSSSPKGAENLKTHNRQFYSDVFWDASLSGKWFLLATTIESGTGKVEHYVDGKLVSTSRDTNMGKPLSSMRIGKADLGNWSDPIQPYSMIRTLNGRIDEFAIFSAVLSAAEIADIYEMGRP